MSNVARTRLGRYGLEVEVRIDCSVCGHETGINLSTNSGSPRINTHSVDGEECTGSRTFVSRRTYEAALDTLKAVR